MKKVVALFTVLLSGCVIISGFLFPRCGDNVLEPGEECEDGNRDSLDGCDSDCNEEPAVCGDAILTEPVICDDGNTVDGDGCTSACILAPEPGQVALLLSGLLVFLAKRARDSRSHWRRLAR